MFSVPIFTRNSILHSLQPSRQIVLLPFLYQTDTILAYTSGRRVGRPKLSCGEQFKDGYGCRHIHSASKRIPKAQKSTLTPNKRANVKLRSDPDPVDYEAFKTTSSRSQALKDPSRSTLTVRERSIFERIYEDILKELPSVNDDGQSGRESQFDQNGETFDGNDSLDSIFEHAIAGARKNDKDIDIVIAPQTSEDSRKARFATKKHVKQSSETQSTLIEDNGMLRSPDTLHENLTAGNLRNATIATEYGLMTDTQRDSQIFQESLAKVASDVDIWNILQNHVFAKMRNFADKVRSHEAQQDAMKRKMERSTRNTRTRKVNGGKDAERQGMQPSGSSLKGEQGKNHPQNPAPSILPNVHYGSELNQHSKEESYMLTPWQQVPDLVHQLSILRSNYAQQCAAALHALRKDYPHSPFVLAVLPHIKSLGPISYVLGASTELYNELLFVHWVYYKDLNGCADLVLDMAERSIIPNARTRTVFKDAERTRERAHEIWNTARASHGQAGNLDQEQTGLTAAAWWFLEGTESGWRKWESAEAQAIREEERRRAANAIRLEQDQLDKDEDEEGDDQEYDDNDAEPDLHVSVPGAALLRSR